MAGSHIAIPTILKIGSGTLGNVGKYLQSSGFKKAVVFFGNGLVEMFGKTVMDSLSEADIEVLSYCELDTTDIKDIIDLAFTIDAKTQVILGIGGGKVIDAGNMPLICGSFHLSACRHRHRVMDFLRQVHHFW